MPWTDNIRPDIPWWHHVRGHRMAALDWGQQYRSVLCSCGRRWTAHVEPARPRRAQAPADVRASGLGGWS